MDSNKNTSKESLHVAMETQRAASELGFDWTHISGVIEKIREETEEIVSAIDNEEHEHAKTELGDLLFAVVNAARFLQADPVYELLDAEKRFSLRFDWIKKRLAETNRHIQECSEVELDELWEAAKRVT